MTGAVTGTVKDQTGAVIPKVRVVATNITTNLTYTTVSNEAGVYNLLFLPIGSYNVTAEIQGFKRTTLGPFQLEINQTARVDIQLEVGDATQSIEIRDIAPTLQTESTQTGDALSSTKLTTVPLNGRNFASLTLLIPGAISTNPNAMNTSGRFQGSGSRPQVNGNREQTNNFLLDGVDVNDSIDNRIGYSPNVDALEEVKVITGNGSSEFGNVGGAIVAMSIKGGTNEVHGNVFEFLRDESLDANGFFANRSQTQRRDFSRHIFGGTLGGPIVRNKAFFFMDYEGTKQNSSGPATASVAPEAWRTGDLSDFLIKQQQIVRDPLTGSDVGSRQPFPGNIIPQSRITNPVAQYLFSQPDLYPLPNNPGTGTLGISSNYRGTSATTLSNHQADVRLDYRPSDADSLTGRWSIGRYESVGSEQPLPTQMTSGTTGPTQSVVLTWTRTFSPRVVNEARFGFSRIGINDVVVDWSGKLGPDGNQKFGIPGGQFIPGLSAVSLGSGLTGLGTAATISNTMDNKFQYGNNLTIQYGAHLLKMGVQFIRYRQNRYYAGNNGALGSFTFDGSYSGIAYGDFLLNALASKGRGGVSGMWGHRQWRDGVFFQDDWKVTSNLTLNLGLRWEYAQPIYEVADRQVNINVVTGELLYAGKDGNSRALYDPYYKQFEPRVGFAWTPGVFGKRLVFRMGYAMSSFMEGTGANLRLTMNPPFFVESNITYDQRTPGDIRTGFSDVIPQGDMTGPRTGPNPFFQARAWDPKLRPQFTQQYNAAIEYQFSNNTSLNMAYVGQLGTHLVVPHEANQPLPGEGPFATWAPINDRRPLAAVLPNVGNIALTESSARMSYNSLQVTGRRRLSSGLDFVSSYTLSKTMMENLGYYGCGSVNSDRAYWQNAYDRRANRGPACFDARHNFSLGGLYELPVGRGKRFGSNFNRAADLVLGGWSINYFVTTHSGFPVTIEASAANTGQAVRGGVRANRYRKMEITSQTVDAFFGPVTAANFCGPGIDDGQCAYGVPAPGMFGTAGIGTERAPSFFNLDMSIGKRFSVTERQYFDFRAEFFNALNHVSFGPPGRDISTPSSFGQITGQVQAPRNIQFGLKYHF
ncbi:MAG TPA: TonB-dependent receptor [Bryobacteraceae bacterium]|nr:TonB-dependent receptor [Bryobacteraceae bacterium]HPU74076.1 TonB-dependent receptor [Bryobacteraceae bacterium]